ncbi:hypothetical protein RN001_002620 [Aquatica leii]|uniref:Uncharacterized protein n=1 Tax=Aquatica leii TaxID=1421715 RepID=A0AAN7SLX2_9COLE|nr:hypothetical protein RN001_002620 [Aquatica leii]
MGRLYGRRPRKGNRAARAQKKAWIIKKAEVQNLEDSNRSEPMIFDDELPLKEKEVTNLTDFYDNVPSTSWEGNDDILPRSLVGEDSLVEVKCIYIKSDVQISSIDDVINLRRQQICLQKTEGGIRLKRNHSYYYQVQGQLNITNKSKCCFIVYVNDKVELHVEEIHRDEQFWNESMLPVLQQFYIECIGPDIIRNNIGNGKRCVDPPYILDAIRQHNEKQKK